MKKYRILQVTLFAAGLMSIQSCFVAKDYQRPADVKTEAKFRTDVVAQDNQSFAMLSWQEFFSDPTLKGHIQKGLDNNLDIRSALQNIAASEAYMKQGKSGYLPTLTVGPTYSYSSSSENTPMAAFTGGRQSQSQYELSGNLSWEADIWGKIRSGYRGATANYLQTVEAHKAVKTSIISAIATTYYQLIALDEQYRTAKETVDYRTQSLETIKALKDAGNVTQVAVNQTEAQLVNAKSLMVDIQSDIKVNENVLSVLLGENPRDINRGNLDQQRVTTNLAIGVPAQLLENRPDVKAAEYQLIASFENVNVANSNFYPALTLTATGGIQGTDFDKLFDAKSLFANVIGRLAQPILNKRAIRTQKEVALAQQEQSLLGYKLSLLNASKEVSDALYRYQAANDKISLKEQEYKLYADAAIYSEELLNYGMANYLEVLTARENSLNAQMNLINTKFEKLNAMVELYRSVGGGWQ